MKRLALALLLFFILSACAPSQPATISPSAVPPPASQPTTVSPTESVSSENNANSASELTRLDEQGAIIVEITPLNLGNPTDQLEFNVKLTTHSVDLGMDLATLATLTTDTGVTVQAATWDAPRGGHHVDGKLLFPATKDGKSILEDASKLTLTITNLDAAARVFEWELK